MAGRQSSKRNPQSRDAAKARRRRVVAMGGTAGAFLAFGLSPLAQAPAAQADGLDLIVEPIINALAGVDPTLGADLTGWVGNLDSALDAASTFDPATVSAASTDLAQLYDQFFYAPAHAFDQQWIDGTSFLGPGTVQFDNFINSLDPNQLLIGNGDPGTLADPNGGAGGLFFGDGGSRLGQQRRR